MAYEVRTRPFGIYVYKTAERTQRIGRFANEDEALGWILDTEEGSPPKVTFLPGIRDRRAPSEGKGRRACQERLREELIELKHQRRD